MSSAICFNLDHAKILWSGNGLSIKNNMKVLPAGKDDCSVDPSDV